MEPHAGDRVFIPQMMRFQMVSTADGSVSCLDTETNQLCHNRAGAYTESVQIYVNPSRLAEKVRNTSEIRVLDACYGLGYNTWALINELIQQPIETLNPAILPLRVSIVAIEKHSEIMAFLPDVLGHPTLEPLKKIIEASEHNTYYRTLIDPSPSEDELTAPRRVRLSVGSVWEIDLALWIDDLRHRIPQLQEPFDAIFHDPFSPQKMPELWTADLFRHYLRLLAQRQGRLLTYSTAAAVRGGLLEAGFQIAKTPGVGSKSGATLAIPSLDINSQIISAAHPSAFVNENLDETELLQLWEEEYLISKAGVPYRDIHLKQSRETILANRALEQAQSSRISGAEALKKKPSYQKFRQNAD